MWLRKHKYHFASYVLQLSLYDLIRSQRSQPTLYSIFVATSGSVHNCRMLIGPKENGYFKTKFASENIPTGTVTLISPIPPCKRQ